MVFGHFFPKITQNCISYLVTNIAIINLGIGCHLLSLGKWSFFLCIPLLFTSIWCLLLLSMCSLEKHTHFGNFISHFCENISNCSPTPKLLSFNPEPQILCYLWNLCIGTSTWPVLDSNLKNKRKQNEVALTSTPFLGSVTKLPLACLSSHHLPH